MARIPTVSPNILQTALQNQTTNAGLLNQIISNQSDALQKALAGITSAILETQRTKAAERESRLRASLQQRLQQSEIASQERLAERQFEIAENKNTTDALLTREQLAADISHKNQQLELSREAQRTENESRQENTDINRLRLDNEFMSNLSEQIRADKSLQIGEQNLAIAKTKAANDLVLSAQQGGLSTQTVKALAKNLDITLPDEVFSTLQSNTLSNFYNQLSSGEITAKNIQEKTAYLTEDDKQKAYQVYLARRHDDEAIDAARYEDFNRITDPVIKYAASKDIKKLTNVEKEGYKQNALTTLLSSIDGETTPLNRVNILANIYEIEGYTPRFRAIEARTINTIVDKDLSGKTIDDANVLPTIETINAIKKQYDANLLVPVLRPDSRRISHFRTVKPEAYNKEIEKFVRETY